MKTPLVSICIPTYNRPKFLYQSIKSCLNQTYKNFEIIVSDTSPNNKTLEAVKKIKDKRLKYYKETPKKDKLNRLMKRAKGKYLKLLFDDDIMQPTSLQKMVAVFESNKNIGVVMAPLNIINEKGNIITPRFYFIKRKKVLYNYLNYDSLVNKEIILKDFLTTKYPCCVPSGIMFRTEGFHKLGYLDMKTDFAGDVEICMRFATKYDFYYINEILNSWRYTETSHTITLHNKGFEIKVFYYLVKKYCKDKKLLKNSLFFASKRAFLLNLVASIRAKQLGLFFATISFINKNDPYLTNKIKLPLTLFQEVFHSFYP